MIKQTWNISSEEVQRILMMHESATKNHYLLNEQMKITKDLPSKSFELPSQTFKSGFYSENALEPNQKKEIENVLNQIAGYINDKKGVPMSIQITTGESTPSNYDRENNKKLNSGDLAKLRGDTMKKILTDFFQGLYDKKIIPYMPTIPEPKTNVQLGLKREPFKPGDNPGNPKFLKDQFIKFSVESSGKETTECLLGLNIRFMYINQTPSNERPCRGGHTCNEAMFDVYLNKTLIGVANLNNQGCEGQDCNRRADLTVNQDMVNSIVNQPNFNNKLMLWYKCKSEHCHSSVPEIYIYNDKKEVLFPNQTFPNPCVAPQATRGDLSSKVLMFLDGCGSPIKVDQTTSAAEMKRLGDEMNADAQAEKDKKDASTKAEQERIAKEKQIGVENQQKFLNDIQTTGLSFVAGKSNTNLFNNNDGFEIVEKVNQGESLLVTVLPKVKTYVQYFMNPYSDKLAKYNTKIDTQFKVSIPIVPISTKERKGKYIRENGLISVGEGLYFSQYNLPNTKNTMGVIVRPSFE
jgi:hypothetical protein